MITLNPLFRDGAVLQQNMPVPIWGRAKENSRLKAEIAGKQAFTKATANGIFMFRLPPLIAGGPFVLEITDLDSGECISVNDILVGEVWLAAGQSNMEYALGSDWVQSKSEKDHSPECTNRLQEREYCNTIQDPSKIRFITVGKNASGLEEETFDGEWEYMSCENAPSASAVAAWFARFVRKKINVPIGLIISTWGGTVAEAWTSRAGLLANPETAALVYESDEILRDENCWNRLVNIGVELPEIPCADPGNKGFSDGWADSDYNDSDWLEMDVPGSWIAQKISGNGALWVRKEIEIPPEWSGKDLVLNMGSIDKQDTTYFNGVKIGGLGKGFESSFWNKTRRYKIPGSLVKNGRNILAVRAYSFLFDGAFHGGKCAYFISQPETEEKIFFAGKWKAKPELDLGVLKPGPSLPGPGNIRTPGILFNGMIRPLIPYAIRGVLWYQGESNAHTVSDALTYEKKLGTLIRDWRYLWGEGDFPFVEVQLANYSPSSDPAFVFNSRWAILREAQWRVSESLSNVFMCSAVDVGDLKDIHPQDKKTVGCRMAENVLHNVYGMTDTVPSGPLYQSHTIEGKNIRIKFRYAEGLHIKKELPQSFYIAGKDRIFYPASLIEIEGDSICLNSENVSLPCAVRYGWSDAAISTLYNSSSLPATPFRTDDWDVSDKL